MNITSIPPEVVLTPQESLLPFLSDGYLAVLLPILVYWVQSMFFHLLDSYELAEKWRIHTSEESEARNKCSIPEVVRAVLIQQAIQVAVGAALIAFEPPYTTGHESYEVWKISHNLGCSESFAWMLYWVVFPSARMVVTFFLMDTWQYMLHRAMHLNKWAYRNFHSVHHRLYVPYAFGALYNSVIEGFLLDTVGTGLAGMITGLTPRETIVLYTFSTMKTVDDHCGYEFPWDPLQWLFPNRSTYHDIHHQAFGIKTNFSQPYFVHWDLLLGSKYKFTEAYIAKARTSRLEAYAKKQTQVKAQARAKTETERISKFSVAPPTVVKEHESPAVVATGASRH